MYPSYGRAVHQLSELWLPVPLKGCSKGYHDLFTLTDSIYVELPFSFFFLNRPLLPCGVEV